MRGHYRQISLLKRNRSKLSPHPRSTVTLPLLFSSDEIKAIAGQTDERAEASLQAIRRLEDLALSLSALIKELKDQSA